MRPSPEWNEFLISDSSRPLPPPRSISTPEGIGDRLRAAAFAELQARDAFLWASENLPDVSDELRSAWKRLADEEHKHMGWLLRRLEELGFGIRDREVSDRLWNSLTSCSSVFEFAEFMAGAEERGRRAGESSFASLHQSDPVSAAIFRKIAEEEIAHIEFGRSVAGIQTSLSPPSFR